MGLFSSWDDDCHCHCHCDDDYFNSDYAKALELKMKILKEKEKLILKNNIPNYMREDLIAHWNKIKETK